MSFAWPEALPVLLLAPVAGVVLLLFDRARARRLRRAVGRRVGILADLRPGRRRLRLVLFSLALLLSLGAVPMPLLGTSASVLSRRSADIVVCLDVSRSMLARDVEPSRLGRARDEIRALAERAAGDRLSLVAFAGEARLLVPLTRDAGSFADLAGRADPLAVPRGGTDLGAALLTALDSLRGRTGRHEVVLLLTDGDDLEGRGLAVAETCRERNITVHCVGFGSKLGAKIPVETETGEAFLTDGAGREVVSALHPVTLERIADRTGGVYVSALPGSLVGLFEDEVLPMARRSFDEEERLTGVNRFQWPLLLAFLLWIVELCLTDKRRR